MKGLFLFLGKFLRGRLPSAIAIAAVVAMANVLVVSAAPPVRWADDWTSEPIPVTDVCPFPFAVVAHQVGSEIDRITDDGSLTAAVGFVKEQDTFTANGHTLVGEPYTFGYNLKLDADGNWTKMTFHGLVQKIRLPDGTLFVSAGYTSFPTGAFGLAPDRGASGDVDAFCAALAP